MAYFRNAKTITIDYLSRQKETKRLTNVPKSVLLADLAQVAVCYSVLYPCSTKWVRCEINGLK